MILQKVNIETELLREKDNTQDIFNQIYSVFSKEKSKESSILKRLNGTNNNLNDYLKIDESESDKIFSIKIIENICIKFRLRFLHSKYFKSEFPYEAIIKIKELEKAKNSIIYYLTVSLTTEESIKMFNQVEEEYRELMKARLKAVSVEKVVLEEFLLPVS